MAKEKTQVVVSGLPSIGIGGALTITFVILKCLGYIAWSWWLVFAPLWISFGLGLLVIGFALALALIVALADK